MGMLLSKPSTTVFIDSNKSDLSGLQFAVGEMQGWRRNMEDAHIASLDIENDKLQSNVKQFSIFGVFDGHGGKEVAKFTQDRFVDVLLSIPEFEQTNFHAALKKSFHKIDELLEDESYTELLKQYRLLPNPSDTIDKQAVQQDKANRKSNTTTPVSTATNPQSERKIRLTTTLAASLFKRLLANEEREDGVESDSPNSDSTINDDNDNEKANNNNISMDELFQELTESFAHGNISEDIDSLPEEDSINLSEIVRSNNDETDLSTIQIDETIEISSQDIDTSNSLTYESGTIDLSNDLINNLTNDQTNDITTTLTNHTSTINSSSNDHVLKLTTKNTTITAATKANPTRPTYRTGARGSPACQLKNHRVIAGCTAVVVLKHADKLYIANAGDSRAVLCRGDGSSFALSEDHKPLQSTEMNRIKQAGGFVTPEGRINGNLNLSRSLGDLKYKQGSGIPKEGQMITAEPDIKEVDLLPDDHFIIIACDGIWDCLTNQEACDYVNQRINEGISINDIVKEVCHNCLSKDLYKSQGIGTDNMTFMIVLLNKQ